MWQLVTSSCYYNIEDAPSFPISDIIRHFNQKTKRKGWSIVFNKLLNVSEMAMPLSSTP